MATGRTVDKWARVYIDGYDLSGYARNIGPLDLIYDEADLTTWTDTVKGYLRNRAQINLGVLNTVFDNTVTVGVHALLGTAGQKRTVSVVHGIRAAPIAGVPVFGGDFTQKAYQAVEEGGAMTATIPFSGWAADAAILSYAAPWGNLLHANTLVSAANVADAGVESYSGAATAKGGYMIYHVTAATGAAGTTATIKVQHSVDEDNANYGDLAGCTTGVIDVGTAPVSGIVATTTPLTTVKKFVRWQVVIGTVTNLTFVLSFMRG